MCGQECVSLFLVFFLFWGAEHYVILLNYPILKGFQKIFSWAKQIPN